MSNQTIYLIPFTEAIHCFRQIYTNINEEHKCDGLLYTEQKILTYCIGGTKTFNHIFF